MLSCLRCILLLHPFPLIALIALIALTALLLLSILLSPSFLPPGYPWWPGQHYQRSALELLNNLKAEAASRAAAGPAHSAASSRGPQQQEESRTRARAQLKALTRQTSGVMMLFFFGDESAAWLSRAEQKGGLVPFGPKVNARELRTGKQVLLQTYILQCFSIFPSPQPPYTYIHNIHT